MSSLLSLVSDPLSRVSASPRYLPLEWSESVDMATSFKSRLYDAAVYAGVEWGQTSIARSLGLKKQTVDAWFKGGEPSMAHLALIARKWCVNAHWLVTGDGYAPIEVLPTPEQINSASGLDKSLLEVLHSWHSLSPNGKAFLHNAFNLAKALRGQPDTRGDPSTKGFQNAPERASGRDRKTPLQSARRRK